MIHFKPDWVETMTAEKFEQEFEMKFNGPGIYFKKDDVMIVIPCDRANVETWFQKFNSTEKFEINVYNNRNPIEDFNLLINAPERS